MTNNTDKDIQQRTVCLDKTLEPDRSEKKDTMMTPAKMAQQPVSAGEAVCPNCGAAIDADADYCETCHTYVRTDICSFCGAHITEGAAYCPECGCSKSGIVCPACHTTNIFSFCRQCGTPLTPEAEEMVREYRQSPMYEDIMTGVRELVRLERMLPCVSEQDMARDIATEQLRVKVLALLAHDRGDDNPHVEQCVTERLTAEQLEARKADIIARLTVLLDSVPQCVLTSPVKARNYVMAGRPVGLRVAWKCNYKHAMHSSPCGCAKPQMGGRWIVLGNNNAEQIKDDN